MKIHHLNCSTFCPLGGHYMDGMTPGIGPGKLVCHCLLIESEQGLILVDTGLGLKDVRHPEQRLSKFFRGVLRPLLVEHETAFKQIRELGFDPNDVRHIILTHLDFDHAGGIDDFPLAQVHVMHAERQAAMNRNSFISKGRYSPAQLEHAKHWNAYFPEGERWYGFQSVRDLEGLPPEILMVPLVGHTEGHAGIAIETDRGWLLHAGDAYFFRGEMDRTYHCTPGLRGYQKMMEVNRRQRIMNQQRLRQLAATYTHEVTIFSAHDAIEYLSMKESGDRHLKSTSTDYRYSFEDESQLGLS
jgi:glyoxylase-like metal-dependent hydrolase (beta-lactamase superfamily II)